MGAIDTVRDEIAAFADDDQDVVIEPSGDVIFTRGGVDVTCRLGIAPGGDMTVDVDGQRVTYRRFLSHYLARLDVFSERLIAKRLEVPAFINGQAKLESVSLPSGEGTALELLNRECIEPSPFAARVTFITADAGHGKTALLRQYQSHQAKRFAEGKSSFVFWHVDLQGRQLLRLSEALMGDLGDLRLGGLWMPAIIVLLRHRLLVLAIDGFDELAAEQGSTDALGALAQLVQRLQDQGTIIAASRRTFFDTEDYIKRAGMLRRAISGQCEFDQIHLLDWTQKEGIAYLTNVVVEGEKFTDPPRVYENIVAELRGETHHPMVSRPFLLAHIARALLRYDLEPSDFIRGMQDPMESVGSVVEAFIKREVTEKWKSKDSGEPYLTVDQHMRLLAAVADEMWRAQKDRLSVDMVETITVILLEEWGIADERKRHIAEMVKMHVLLVIPSDADATMRSFDHPEFRNYFTAVAFAALLKEAVGTGSSAALGRFLAPAQLPDSVARYAASLVDKQEYAAFLNTLCELVGEEWRPTYLQGNVGTIIPSLLHGVKPETVLIIDSRIVYSSLVFERTALTDVRIENGQFLRTSFSGVEWQNVTIANSEMSDVTFDVRASYQNVVLEGCRIDGVRVTDYGDTIHREFAPARIAMLLASLGVTVTDAGRDQISPVPATENYHRRLVNRILRTFQRTTALSENVMRLKWRHDMTRIIDEIIPLMVRHGILVPQSWRGGSPSQTRWVLARSLEDVLRADGPGGDRRLQEFWREVDKAP